MSTEQLINCGVPQEEEARKAGLEEEMDEDDLPLARVRENKQKEDKERDASPSRKSPKKAATKSPAKPLTREQLARQLEEAGRRKKLVRKEEKAATKAVAEAKAKAVDSAEAELVRKRREELAAAQKALAEAEVALRKTPAFEAVAFAKLAKTKAKQAVYANGARRCQLKAQLASLKEA